MVKRPTPRLDRLFFRIRRLTKERGAKASLADVLGVVPQRLHEWLSGSVEPGGETTLHLLEWVAAVEASTKRNPARAETRTGRKTRSAKVDENKSKSDRKKR